ncbi:restriction endonuclease subunit S [Aquabacterium sp.]|uniref:restriction endonuclease subunit S n=1 Tax=Aquabacterium sp. TaxID=1872578 RepID=UPI003D6D8231
MTALVTRHLPLVADAPDGIKKLRALILELAVRGKLVPQDAMDGFANSHLEEAEYSGKQIHFDGPFCLPKTWKWVRLGDTLDMVNGRAFKPTEWISSGLPIVRIQNLNRPDAEFNFCDEVTVASRHVIDTGTLLISWSGTPGTSFGAFIWNRGRAALNQHIFSCIQKRASFFDRFLQVAINTRLEELIAKAHGGVGLQHVTKGKLEALTLALPPLKEQHRIVAKVDELMALCDRLEADQADAEAAHVQLVQALLDSLTQATDAADFRASWQRLSEHFHTLFTTEASIDALKQTVLQLAVGGALVDCDVAGMPASALLDQIGLTEGHAIRPAEPLWHTPESWRWAQLGSVLSGGLQNGISPKPVPFETSVRCLTLGATTRGRFNGTCFKHVELDACVVPKYLLKSGDLLVQRANSIDYVGVSAVYDAADDQYIYPDLMMRMRVSSLMSLRFVHLCLSSLGCRAYMRSKATGTQGNMPKINQGTVGGVPIPVPQLEVQHRIVAKVDELMALCDQLKVHLADARQQHAQLATVLVEQAVAA